MLFRCKFGIGGNYALFWVQFFRRKFGCCKESYILHVFEGGGEGTIQLFTCISVIMKNNLITYKMNSFFISVFVVESLL